MCPFAHLTAAADTLEPEKAIKSLLHVLSRRSSLVLASLARALTTPTPGASRSGLIRFASSASVSLGASRSECAGSVGCVGGWVSGRVCGVSGVRRWVGQWASVRGQWAGRGIHLLK